MSSLSSSEPRLEMGSCSTERASRETTSPWSSAGRRCSSAST
ncbi:hypothetical protein EYF80_065940 [Liparis tanakae]|uniref:Uncharacterized protein n=1 Tax=Liparis tanakae TaxID=230148 RepID=A0A4Z2E5E1_9TELE|nr:hypothetical protein EYF80_065940 [Liparis tanakae]